MTPRQFRAWRAWSGLKQEEVCEAANISRQTLFRFEQFGEGSVKTKDKLITLVDMSEVGFRKDGCLVLPS